MGERQRLYAYLDESGQDASSEYFVVVAVVTDAEQDRIRKELEAIEEEAQTHSLKWHKTSHTRRMRYLSLVLERSIASGTVYAAHFKKPIPFFFPMLEVLEKAIKRAAHRNYRASIYVDGIDRYKAVQLTNALRASGISLTMVRGRRDESEPLIRLADMWAGCIRSALLDHKDTHDLLLKARRERYLTDLTP
jgi:hypothetical protein